MPNPYARTYKTGAKQRSERYASKTSASARRSRKRVSYPARLKGSRINYQVAKAVSRAMDKVSENKIIPCDTVNEVSPARIQALALATTKSFTLGNIPAVWSGVTGLQTLSGMNFPLGVGHAQREGKYIYLQKTRVTMEIDMNTIPDFSIPVEFRVICCKARRGNNPSGITNNFANTLFLGTDGNEFGHATSGINGTDLMVQPINKKDWSVRTDKKFMLTNPLLNQDLQGSGVTTTYAGKYPVFKRMVFNLPFYAKTEIDTNMANRPADLDYNYLIIVYAKGLGKDYVADKYEINVRGSTTFKDN